MWYIGQEVVYLTGINAPKHKVFEIGGIHPFPCGAICFSFGVPCYDYTTLRCPNKCCQIIHPCFDVWKPDSFAPLDSLMKEEIAELMKCDEVFGVKINEK